MTQHNISLVNVPPQTPTYSALETHEAGGEEKEKYDVLQHKKVYRNPMALGSSYQSAVLRAVQTSSANSTPTSTKLTVANSTYNKQSELTAFVVNSELGGVQHHAAGYIP